MRRAVICAALAAALASESARGQTATQPVALTETDAIARVSTDSPRARAARAGIEIARADVLSAARWPNPRITWDRESVAGVTEHIVMVAQPLPITGRRGFDVQAASAMVEAVSSRAEDEIRRLRADLRLVFANLVSAQARERELTEARDRLRELTGVLAKRESAGEAAGFDRLRAEREVTDVEGDRALAATERARAQALMASFFAEALDPTRIVAVPPSMPRRDVPAIDALITRAETTRGEIRALQRELDAARFAQRAADRIWIPEPELVAGTKSSTVGTGELGSVVTVQASIPLFDRGRPERALALARAAQAEARMAAFRAVIRNEIIGLRAAVVQGREAADRYRSEAVASSQEIERIALVSYEAGERGILELLDAYRGGVTARIRQAVLDVAARQAEIELEFASGWEIQ